MDISVSRLNNRLALQLPTELPLGLVFVVGSVENVRWVDDKNKPVSKTPSRRIELDLIEASHRLHCRLTRRASSEVNLQNGDKIRAGGHLTFDPSQANYYLLARDIEMVEEAKPVKAATEDEAESELPLAQVATPSILADLAQRSDKSSLAPAELPQWVRKIAPPELQAEVNLSRSDLEEMFGEDEPSSEDVDIEIDETAETADHTREDLVAYLSAAMESNEDVELDQDMISELELAETIPPPKALSSKPYDVPASKANITLDPQEMPAPESKQTQPQPQQADSMMILLIITIVVFVLTALVIAVLLFLR